MLCLRYLFVDGAVAVVVEEVECFFVVLEFVLVYIEHFVLEIIDWRIFELFYHSYTCSSTPYSDYYASYY